MKPISAVLLAAFAASAFGTYTWYFTDPMQSLQTSYWATNGSPQFTNVGGYWAGYSGSSSGNVSSMVSTVAVPDGTSSYAVRATLRFPNSNGITGIMDLLLRASTTFNSSSALPTTAYAVRVLCGDGPVQVAISKIVNGVETGLSSAPGASACSDGMTVRAEVDDSGQIFAFANDAYVTQAQDSSIATGAPGIALPWNIQPGDSMLVSQVQLGPADRIAPSPIPTNGLTYSVYSNHIDFQWQPVSDDTNGTGLLLYQFLRDDQWAQNTTSLSWSDTTVQPGVEYSYTFEAQDFFFNTVSMTVNITVPPLAGSPPTPPDGRRVGVRSTGAYWGASTEQIDVLSGNLNYTIPMLKTQARTGWGVGFNLAYNSQNWRLDSSGTWNLGEDVGYGYGWKLLAGSLTPIWANQTTLAYYSFVDSTGAEYRLTQNNSGIWTSLESVYVFFNSNTNTLYFRDGTYWVMGSTSADTADLGTMYPTTMEDTNGNQIFITYLAGGSQSGTGSQCGNQVNGPTNSSARISLIRDVRGEYVFCYNADSPHHLTSIINGVGTSESYTFSYGSLALQSPFSPFAGAGTVSTLSNVTYSTTSQQHSFVYASDNSGDLAQAFLPNGGALTWAYQNVTYGNGATYREISQRQLSKDGVNFTTYPFTYGSSPGNSTNQSTTITDAGGVGQKSWTFSQSGANAGMVTQYQGQQLPGPVTKTQNAFTWNQDNLGNLYIGSTVTTLDPGQTYQFQKQTDQTVDTYGNVLKVLQFDYNSLTTPARIYTYTYLSSSAYTAKYIFNRLTQATLANGPFATVTLATMAYDSSVYNGGQFTSVPTSPSPPNWDTSYSTVSVRGDVTASTSINDVSAYAYDQAGNVTISVKNGILTTVTPSTAAFYAAPSQLSVGSLTSSLDWSSFLGLTSATGPNGDSSSVSYDSSARPLSSASPYGATTNYTYSSGPNSASNPATSTATTNGRWTKTTLDGLGRTITVQTGNGSTVVSQTDTVYGSCGCSPTGKLLQQSLPHAPGATPAWTTYNYDGIGRTLSVVAPDGASTTGYSYQGNTVTVTDPAGKTKTFTMDAFGHLTRVSEPNPAGGANYITTYAYDAWDNLSQVSMPRPSGTQTRTFVYNGKLLTSATNPENGTVTYTYNAYNKVATKTDAKGQATKYTYDGYSRLTEVQRYPTGGISGTEDTCQQELYYYDTSYNSYNPNYTSGRLTAVQYQGGFAPCNTTFTDTYGYTQAGLKTNKGLLLARNSAFVADLEATYTYDNEGRTTGVQYPGGGPNFTYAYDTMGRLNTMTNVATTHQIVSGTSYDAANRLTAMRGDISEGRNYNLMGQLTQVTQLLTVSPGTGLNISYNYSATQNNGKITSQTDNLTGEQVVYAYDALNRLASAAATSGAWGQSYAYDGFGNLTNQTVTAGTAPSLSVSYNASNNLQTTDCADANGNILVSGATYNCNSIPNGAAYSYDVANRLHPPTLFGVVGTFYSYAPGNKRVWRGAVDINQNITLDEVTFWGADGKKLATYTPGTNAPLTTNAYFGSRLISNNIATVVTDRLGSVGKYYPWGQEKPSATTNGTEKFTGYFRDQETGLDYAKNRYHQPGMGRFMTPDPYMALSTGGSDPTDPGSWNRYAYASGDPIGYTDPLGLIACCQDGPDPGGGNDGHGGGLSFFGRPGGELENCGWGGVTIPVSHGGFGVDPKLAGCGESVGGTRGGPKPPVNANCNNPGYANAINFINTNEAAAQQISDATGIPVNFILALAASETGWTGSSVSANNNYFNLRLPANSNPATSTGGWIGATACNTLGTYSPGWACFSSNNAFYNSGMSAFTSFGDRYGNAIMSALDSGASYAQAAQAMANAGYDPGNSSYGANFQGAYNVLTKVISCQ